ncbi:acetyltransferase [Macrococcoides canis]|uniref:acetyltransferase n=1 Tax=Macrococcoides canis TaxID=1855823 RepID=UPI0020B678B0|nr:acetyltransferase [Macrococcus canis]UTH00865.1 acetyltransferase [Macrococcus canis]UTH03230.1 acetyltransferase [Macrococcus canis]
MNNDIIIVGAGGHANSVIDSIEEIKLFNIVGYIDNYENSNISYPYLGNDMDAYKYIENGINNVVICIGTTKSNEIRKNIIEFYESLKFNFPKIISKSALVSNKSIIEDGVFIGKNVVINSGAKIHKHSIINTGVIIEHDCTIGKYCHIAPGSVISGCVNIGVNTHVGTNSTIIQNINIGENTTIGAGSVVVKDIDCNKLGYGVPFKEV